MGLSLDVGSANPGAARKASHELSLAAQQVSDLGTQIAQAVGTSLGQGMWTGSAAEAFVTHINARIQAANAIAQGLQQGADVLATYADQLATAKKEWDKAMAQVQSLPGPLKAAVLAGEALTSFAITAMPVVGQVAGAAFNAQAQLAGAQLMAAEELAMSAAADCALGLNATRIPAQDAETLLGNSPQGLLANVDDFQSGLEAAAVNTALSLAGTGALVEATEFDANAAGPEWQKTANSILNDPGSFARNSVNWDEIWGEWKSGHPGQALGDGLFTLGMLVAGAAGGASFGGDAAGSAARAAAEAGAEDAARGAAEGAAAGASDGAAGSVADGLAGSTPQSTQGASGRSAASGGASAETRGTVDLPAAEKAGGHTVARHVGMTADQLRARNIPLASSFTDMSAAEAATADNIAANQGAIMKWLSGTSPRLVIQNAMDPSGGTIYVRATQTFIPPRAVSTVLVRTPTGYNVLTSYPIP